MIINIVKVKEGAVIPVYQTPGAAGADLHGLIDKQSILMYPGSIHVIPTGISVQIPEGFEMQIRSRSGLASKGIVVINSPGTVDSDFRGEVKVLLANLSDKLQRINSLDRIAQMIISPIERASFVEVEYLEETERNDGEMGSTGS